MTIVTRYMVVLPLASRQVAAREDLRCLLPEVAISRQTLRQD